jgi:photosystem II stability/assembly factor-like uncharacterized protein
MKRVVLFVLIFVALNFTVHLYGGNNVWTGHGPFIANFQKLIFSASNPKVGYGWNNGNFMRTTDGGSTWLHIRLPDYYGFPTALAIHPRNSNIVYAARTSIYFSSDRGLHWRLLSSLSEQVAEISDLKIDQNHPGILYAAAKGALDKRFTLPARLFKSADGGKTWTLFFSSTCCLESESAVVELHPSNPKIVYAAFDFKLFQTTNGGISWKSMKIRNSVITDLKINPSNRNVLYAVTYDRIWKSTNGGQRWFSTGGRCIPNFSIDPRNPDVLYAAGHIAENYAFCLQKSIDGGKTWFDLHVPRPSLLDEFSALATSKKGLYISTDLLYRSFSGGTNWNVVVNNKGNDAEYGIQIDDGPAFNLFAFRQQRVYFSKSARDEWILLHTPDQFGIRDLQIHPSDSTWIALAGGFGTGIGSRTRSLLISHNTAKTWQFLSTPFRFTSRVIFHPSDKEKIFVIGDTYPRTVFGRSLDEGKTWKISRIPLAGNPHVAFTSNPFVIYVANGRGLAKSEDEGKTWKILSNNIVSTYITTLALGRPGTVYVAAANGDDAEVPVYKSVDGGVTWEKKATFRGFYYFVKVHPADPNIVFAGGEDGLFVSKDAGENWTPFQKNGISGSPEIQDIVISRAHPEILFGNFLTGVYSYTWLR